MRKLMLLAVLPLSLASCTYYNALGNPSGSSLQFQVAPDKYTVLGPAEGEACAGYWFGSGAGGVAGSGAAGGGIPSGGKNTYQEAVKAAIKAKNGDHFIQIASDFKETWYLIYREVCVNVYGQVVKLK